VEVADALLSIAFILVPSMKEWVDSVAYRNRAQARAALIRARLGEEIGQRGEEPGKKRRKGLG